MNKALSDKMEELFDELVPPMGKADTEAGRYLLKHDHDNDGVFDCIKPMWGNWSDDDYEAHLDELGWVVLEIIANNPDTRTNPTEDMWDHFDKYEDVDDTEDDEWEEW